MAYEYKVSHYKFIHHVFGNFVRGITSWLSNELFDDSTQVVIGTYEKAIQHFERRRHEADETHHPQYPFLTLDPRLDFEPEDQAGQFSQNYPAYSGPRIALKNWGPDLFDDGNVIISPVLNRYKGSFEVIVWCRSVYEYMDLRLLTYQYFGGGRGREVYPKNISGNFQIDDRFYYYDYTNPYTKQTYRLDWTQSRAESTLFKAINQDKWIYPFEITPRLKMTGVNDASEKYGGDNLSEYKMMIDLEWEVNLPTHLVLYASHLPQCNSNVAKVQFDISTGVVYQNPTGHTAGEFIIDIYDEDGEITSDDLIYQQRVDYIMTQSDIDAIVGDNEFLIDLPQNFDGSTKQVKIFHASGPLRSLYEYCVVDLDRQIKVIPVDFKDRNAEVGDILVILLYEIENS